MTTTLEVLKKLIEMSKRDIEALQSKREDIERYMRIIGFNSAYEDKLKSICCAIAKSKNEAMRYKKELKGLESETT